jgi:hypothetical protein
MTNDELIYNQNNMEKWEKELFILRRKLNWFINGYGIHGITWNQFKHLTPEWIVKHIARL